MGGERVCRKRRRYGRAGSSPRGRGTLVNESEWYEYVRIIPAWAGNARHPTRAPRSTPDHPRVGGERLAIWHGSKNCGGSSPRGRGTLEGPDDNEEFTRIIPAWAGNATAPRNRSTLKSDHPRVGGERSIARMATALSSGSSPRGRGTRCHTCRSASVARIIPAWAGNAPFSGRASRRRADHPRVGGERGNGIENVLLVHGSSPRGRGTPRPSSSPRSWPRIIPAWAGNADHARGRATVSADHPRVGGERPGPRETGKG